MESRAAGRRIRGLREQKAWTQEHLAAAAEVSVRTVQRAEDGVLSAETLQALASALDEPVESLSNPRTPYPRVTPVLYYDDPATLEWLERAFGLRARIKIPGPDGRIVHGELSLGDGVVMVGVPVEKERWATPRQQGGTVTQSLYVMVDDVPAHCDRARQAGARILTEPEEVHGQRRYRAADPEGHHWWFAEVL